eukprot:45093-Pelagomonas_calceolata.AAC.6
MAISPQLASRKLTNTMPKVRAVADAQQRKQDEEWAMRERARQQLMAEVDAIRQEQIRDKQARQLAALEEEMRYKMQIDKVGDGKEDDVRSTRCVMEGEDDVQYKLQINKVCDGRGYDVSYKMQILKVVDRREDDVQYKMQINKVDDGSEDEMRYKMQIDRGDAIDTLLKRDRYNQVAAGSYFPGAAPVMSRAHARGMSEREDEMQCAIGKEEDEMQCSISEEEEAPVGMRMRYNALAVRRRSINQWGEG